MPLPSPASSSKSPESQRQPRTLKYPLEWAYGVVERAIQSRARVWEIFMSETGISKRHLAMLIASGDPDWPRIRSICQILDRWEIQQARVGHGVPLNLSTSVWLAVGKSKNTLSESLRIYLTEQKKRLKLEKQVKEGEGGGLRPSPSATFLPAPRNYHAYTERTIVRYGLPSLEDHP